MMDIEKAIEEFKKSKYVSKNLKIEHIDLAIEALEKQISKKPIDTEEAWLCPNCKSHIHHEQQSMHCRQCGQLVVWR